jgi:hypothetical protein
VFWGLTNQTPEWLTNYPASYQAPYGYGDAYAINDQDQIVGASMQALSYPVGVLWQLNQNTNGASSTTNAPFWEITDLNNRLTDNSWTVFNAVGINNDSLILAYATAAAGQNHAVLLIPMAMAVDNNRDGQITFDAADQTSPNKPYSFWVNNDHDGYCTVSGETSVQDDLDPSKQTDAQSFSITCARDLEDFTRLWINTQGIAKELQDGTLLLALEWKDAVDDPQMQLFQAAETNGGSLYLTDTKVAAQQVASPYGTRLIEWRHLNTLTKYNPFIFPTKFWSNISADQPEVHLLFDAVSRGSGRLVMSFYKSDGVTKIGEGPAVYLDLKDIKEMYERWTVGDDNGGTPASRAVISELRLPAGVGPFRYDSQSPEANQYILFVHGWNLAPWERDAFAETAFKRLYWQGYKGRFGAFEWPTTYYIPIGLPGDDVRLGLTFDPGEQTAWQSAAPLEMLLNSLHDQYGSSVYVFAHSHGNVVVGEALRKGAQDGLGKLVNTYVACQAAVSGNCYDSGLNGDDLLDFGLLGRYGPETPNIYNNWLSYTNAASTKVNFYNVNDYALSSDHWQFDQITKPDNRRYSYWYASSDLTTVLDLFFKYPTGGDPESQTPLHLGNLNDVMDRYEITAWAAESRSKALGGIPSVNGFTAQNLQRLWLPDPFETDPNKFYSKHPWHSAEFRFTNMEQRTFWETLMTKFGMPTNP